MDVADVVAVILSWRLCTGPPPAICLADVDFDGTVDRQDLDVIIDAWGAQ